MFEKKIEKKGHGEKLKALAEIYTHLRSLRATTCRCTHERRLAGLVPRVNGGLGIEEEIDERCVVDTRLALAANLSPCPSSLRRAAENGPAKKSRFKVDSVCLLHSAETGPAEKVEPRDRDMDGVVPTPILRFQIAVIF